MSATTLIERLSSMLRANFPALLIRTSDEERALTIIRTAAAHARRKVSHWSIMSGLVAPHIDNALKPDGTKGVDGLYSVLEWMRSPKSPPHHVLVLCDAHPYIWPDPQLTRLVREVASAVKTSNANLCLVGAAGDAPRDLELDLTPFDVGLPDAEEIGELIKVLTDAGGIKTNGEIKDIVSAALGLTRVQAENALSLSIVDTGKFDSLGIMAEKKRLVRESGVLEFVDVAPAHEQIGGLDLLQQWLLDRRNCFADDARQYGLDPARGVMFVGPSGCGKSASAKAVAVRWKLPLLRLDVSRMHGSLLGQSEALLRRAIETAEAVAPSILWIDEIEKVMGGRDRHETSQRQAAHLLTWMQEHRTSVFLWATANDVTTLPPELMRAGRFDEVFACDLPARIEREQILAIHLARRGRTWSPAQIKQAINGTVGFSGAEIEAALTDAMFRAYMDDRREVGPEDFQHAAALKVPLSHTMRDQMEALRSWYRHRARPASSMINEASREADADAGRSDADRLSARMAGVMGKGAK